MDDPPGGRRPETTAAEVRRVFRGRKGAAMSQAELVRDMPVNRSGTNAPALARGLDRGARNSKLGRSGELARTDVLASAIVETASFVIQGDVFAARFAWRLVPCWHSCPWSRRARSGGRIGRTGSWPVRSRTRWRAVLIGSSTVSPTLTRLNTYQPRKPEVASSGVVVLSIEPAVVVPGTATEAAVVFPGYVLPDDSREDSLHEGS